MPRRSRPSRGGGHPQAAEVEDASPKTLARGRWGAVVDPVGGAVLAGVLKSVLPGGAVAAIGMAGGHDLPTSVHPFILRGVTLAGIDAASMPTQAERTLLWARLAELWPRLRGRLRVKAVDLADVGAHAATMLAGTSVGRAVVVP
jgi:acrylyl-CoA reductase (NADPH)